MTLLRMALLGVAIALGTVLVGWWIVPLLGALYGVVARGTPWPGLVAGLAGGIGWGGYLAIVGFGGAPISKFAGDLAHAMSLPTWGPHVATLLFPAALSGLAASLTAQLLRRPPAKGR